MTVQTLKCRLLRVCGRVSDTKEGEMTYLKNTHGVSITPGEWENILKEGLLRASWYRPAIMALKGVSKVRYFSFIPPFCNHQSTAFLTL
jgi:hypothetical protein